MGRTKIRTEDAIYTLPDSKHADNIIRLLGLEKAKPSSVPGKKLVLTETSIVEVDEESASTFRSAVGSGIFLSLDRRDIRYAVKELAKRLQKPRHADYDNLNTSSGKSGQNQPSVQGS